MLQSMGSRELSAPFWLEQKFVRLAEEEIHHMVTLAARGGAVEQIKVLLNQQAAL